MEFREVFFATKKCEIDKLILAAKNKKTPSKMVILDKTKTNQDLWNPHRVMFSDF